MNDLLQLCSGCVYWESAQDDDGSAGARRGRCRRYPPVISAAGNDVALWPRTRRDDWCGEWRSRESLAAGGSVSAAETGHADDLDPREECWLRNVSMAQALMVLPAQKRDAVLEAVLTEEERQSPTPPDDFYDRVQLYFAAQKKDEPE